MDSFVPIPPERTVSISSIQTWSGAPWVSPSFSKNWRNSNPAPLEVQFREQTVTTIHLKTRCHTRSVSPCPQQHSSVAFLKVLNIFKVLSVKPITLIFHLSNHLCLSISSLYWTSLAATQRTWKKHACLKKHQHREKENELHTKYENKIGEASEGEE